jgi:hypothetical protein
MRKMFNVDVRHLGDVTYYYDIVADNAATAIEIAIVKYMREYQYTQIDRQDISGIAY